jgi:hypothetical protein
MRRASQFVHQEVVIRNTKHENYLPANKRHGIHPTMVPNYVSPIWCPLVFLNPKPIKIWTVGSYQVKQKGEKMMVVSIN